MTPLDDWAFDGISATFRLSFTLFFSQSLLEAHDIVASKCYEVPPPPEMSNDAAVNNALMQADAVRMIGIRKKAGEPLVSACWTRVCVCV